jgi:MobA/MobL family
MAIFSLNHSFIGRSTHPPGAASLYARYITRPEACKEVIGARMPTERGELMQWLDAQEQGDRKNARVIDKVIVALPIELSHEQYRELLEDYCERMTEGRASWLAAIHDRPADRDNPHAHIIFRDRDVDTSRRVMLTTEPGSTERFRDGWEQEVNIALERAGFDERIDKRSLEAQGIDREAQLHVGAGALRLAQREYEFTSNEKEITRIIHGERTTVTVNYPVIDEGKTRFEENEERKQRNVERERFEQLSGMEQVLYAHDRLDWLYAHRNEEPPAEDDVLAFLVWRHATRYQTERRERSPDRDGERKPAGDPQDRAPKHDAGDLVAGAGLALFDRLATSIESLFDDRPRAAPDEPEQSPMSKEPSRTNQPAEEQKKLTEAELAASRKAMLEAYLEQRDRERHIERGR